MAELQFPAVAGDAEEAWDDAAQAARTYHVTERRIADADLRGDGWHLSHRTVHDLTGPAGEDLGTYASRDAALSRVLEIEVPGHAPQSL